MELFHNTYLKYLQDASDVIPDVTGGGSSVESTLLTPSPAEEVPSGLMPDGATLPAAMIGGLLTGSEDSPLDIG